jgi:hypothetical protein
VQGQYNRWTNSSTFVCSSLSHFIFSLGCSCGSTAASAAVSNFQVHCRLAAQCNNVMCVTQAVGEKNEMLMGSFPSKEENEGELSRSNCYLQARPNSIGSTWHRNLRRIVAQTLPRVRCFLLPQSPDRHRPIMSNFVQSWLKILSQRKPSHTSPHAAYLQLLLCKLQDPILPSSFQTVLSSGAVAGGRRSELLVDEKS